MATGIRAKRFDAVDNGNEKRLSRYDALDRKRGYMKLENNPTAELLDEYQSGAAQERKRLISKLRDLEKSLRSQSDDIFTHTELLKGIKRGYKASADEVKFFIKQLEKE